jgi:hypothetical protein
MPDNERNSWDHANRQGENHTDFNNDYDAHKSKGANNEETANRATDDYGYETGRSDQSGSDKDTGNRGGHASSSYGEATSARQNEDLSSGSSGEAGRSSASE